MTSRERVLAAVRGQEVWPIPISVDNLTAMYSEARDYRPAWS